MAAQINTKLCNKFSIPYYPMLLWAPPAKFIGGRWNGKKENSEFTPIDDGRTAERLLKWINTQLGRYFENIIIIFSLVYACVVTLCFRFLFSSYRFDDAKFENDELLHSNASDSEQVDSKVNLIFF